MVNRRIIVTALAAFLSCAAFTPDAQATPFLVGDFVTYSQDSWGTTPSPGNAADLLLERFDFVYPAGMEVGIPGLAGFSMFFTSAAGVLDYLPASGVSGSLHADLLDPTSSAAGEFGGHVVALQLNVDFNDAGDLTGTSGIAFGDLVLHDLIVDIFGSPTDLTAYNGLTVREFLSVMHGVLGGTSVDSYDNVAALIDLVARSFDGGTPSAFAPPREQGDEEGIGTQVLRYMYAVGKMR